MQKRVLEIIGKTLGLALLISLFIITGMVFAQAKPGPNIEAKAVKKVPPIYPPLAKRKHVEGKVVISLQVSGDGSVTGAEFVDGNSMFKPVSLEAARQWVFQKSAGGLTGYITFNFEIKED